MFAAAVSILIVAVMAGISLSSDVGRYYLDLDDSVERYEAVVNTASAIHQFHKKNFRYPNSLVELINSDEGVGIRHQKLLNNQIVYSVSQLSDSTNDVIYKRYIVALSKTSELLDSTSYLAENYCGSGEFDNAEIFCGSPSSYWLVNDEKEVFKTLAQKQSSTFNFISQYYFYQSAFPKKKHNGLNVALGKGIPMRDIVGTSTSSNDCRGFFNFESVTLGCEGIFSVDGGDIMYQYNSERDILLWVEMPFKKTDGTPHFVIKELVK